MPESNRRTDAPLSRAIVLAREALVVEPAGLAADIDGTLSSIVDDPGAARLADGVAGALAGLAGRLMVVAAITGRSAADARRMLGVDGVLVAGNHGTEWLDPDATEPTPVAGAVEARSSLVRALVALPAIEGAVIEEKGLSATIHYRGAADPDRTHAAILAALSEAGAGGLEVREGRMSVELRPSGLGDKGSAVRAVVERFGLRGLVVLGDDVTDLDMFGAVAGLRRAGTLRGAIIGVGGGGEVPSEVAGAADIVLRDPGEVAELLLALAAAFDRGA